MSEEAETNQPMVPPIKIEIEKGQKNTYAWTVRVYADSVDEALEQVRDADRKLRSEYGQS